MKTWLYFFWMGALPWAKKGLPAIMFEWYSRVWIPSPSCQRLPILRLWLHRQRWTQAAGELHQDLATWRDGPLCGGGPIYVIIFGANYCKGHINRGQWGNACWKHQAVFASRSVCWTLIQEGQPCSDFYYSFFFLAQLLHVHSPELGAPHRNCKLKSPTHTRKLMREEV